MSRLWLLPAMFLACFGAAAIGGSYEPKPPQFDAFRTGVGALCFGVLWFIRELTEDWSRQP